MYPFRNKWRWIVSSRYGHLIRGVRTRRSELQDPLLDARVEALGLWNRIRGIVSVVLSLGVIATVGAAIGAVLPQSDLAVEFFRRMATVASAFTGALTVVYLFLTRLLSQLEMDVLLILGIDH